MKNLLQLVLEAIADDDGYKEIQDKQIRADYLGMDSMAQEAVDKIFIRLCGWSLKTLLLAKEKGIEPCEVNYDN